MEKEAVVAAVTKAAGRKSLYHFTRASNLPAIARLDGLLSSFVIDPAHSGERRTEARPVTYGDHAMTVNAHLSIPEHMMEAGCTLREFRSVLDTHVFFWPTVRDCQKMLDTYSRREPDEAFAILQLDAYALLLEHFGAVKLSKYDSGSSPRFPHRCSYKKSSAMFLPLAQFRTVSSSLVPRKASEIREILVEGRVTGLSRYMQCIYVEQDACSAVPERWRQQARPLAGAWEVNRASR
ncbi:hypothetical protein PAESOLCIP111_03366 [Paenibacillus solanacearum]|uniref:Uncharacterized protein n=1 Tax=Paenibacillus solanacearum TaxID=2048548 RepID=A0A916K555_9BACL|nr:hypothetical protein [Paenibacillus solanacearum]CAG7632302.1 hypothetical protein PAESOLCIP111_03366 [Paenibacillus solanacearum]